jgi:hypothetical protein
MVGMLLIKRKECTAVLQDDPVSPPTTALPKS